MTNSIQLSHTLRVNNRDEYILSVITKRGYKFNDNGQCIRQEEIENLAFNVEIYEEGKELLKKDFDVYPYKPYTDVIIKGSAYNHDNVPSFLAQIQLGNHKPYKIQVSGNRKAFLAAGTHRIQFTQPTLIESVPLTFDNAYGGADIGLEEQLEPMPKEVTDAMSDVNFAYSSVYRYPRNPDGKGYVVEKSQRVFENLELPNLEHTLMPLTPQNIVINEYENWLMQPLPVATDWVNFTWFPRIAYLGILPFYNKKFMDGFLPEMVEKLIEPDFDKGKEPHERLNIRSANGAHPALQLPLLQVPESIVFTNIHPTKKVFELLIPKEVPIIATDGRKGRLNKTHPVIHTIIVDFNTMEVEVLWRGSSQAIRPYYEEELQTMPFEVKW